MNQNLLSQQEKIILKNGYRKRLVALTLWGIFAASIVSSVVFLPVLFMARIKITNLNSKEGASSALIEAQKNILSLPTEINEDSKIILSLENASNISRKIYEVEQAKLSGISLTGFTYRSGLDQGSKGQATILVSGMAKDRDSLISFNKALKDLDFIKDVTVPVDSFAKETDLSFVATMILK